MDPLLISVNPLKKPDTDYLGYLNKSLGVAEDNVRAVQLRTPSPMDVTAEPPHPLGPVTPDSVNESGGGLFFSNLKSHLASASFESEQDNDSCLSNDDCPCTPKKDVFDAFVPGPDNCVLAPDSVKYLEESQSHMARRLNFKPLLKFIGEGNRNPDSDARAESDDVEEMLLETLYQTLLEAIVSKQIEEFIEDSSTSDSRSDGFTTPTSANSVHPSAVTCPGAPLKPVRTSRSIDPSLCRKLEF